MIMCSKISCFNYFHRKTKTCLLHFTKICKCREIRVLVINDVNNLLPFLHAAFKRSKQTVFIALLYGVIELSICVLHDSALSVRKCRPDTGNSHVPSYWRFMLEIYTRISPPFIFRTRFFLLIKFEFPRCLRGRAGKAPRDDNELIRKELPAKLNLT